MKKNKSKMTVSDLYWDEEYKKCREESKLVRRKVVIDELVKIGLMFCIVGLLTIILTTN